MTMTDGMGSVTYVLDSLSRVTSETRAFTGLGNFTLSYTYNLSGQLTSITDPFSAQISYTHDVGGRVTGVTGSSFASVSTYASSVQYRAWGAVKSLSYGNSKTLALTYDANLKPLTYEVPGTMKKAYTYYNDGRLKFIQDQLTANSKFDRLYRYDHVGRSTIALSGLEAREQGTTDDRPYNETMTYDALSHLTSREIRQWDRHDLDVASYSNNRRIGWNYDADGRELVGANQFTYDAAGQITKFGFADPNETDQQLDGDGGRAKTTLKTYDQSNGQLLSQEVTYLVKSTVLGQVISEVSATGAKQRSFVYAGGQLLAIQRVTAGGQAVEWPYFDASGASHRVVNVNGINVKSAENDPLGANAGLFKPITWPPPSSPGKIEPFYGVPELNSATQGCVADGVPIHCDMALPMLTNGFATLTHIDPLLASAGKKRPVWIPQDTSYGTANLNTLVVTIYSGSGGYFVWVEETVGQKLSPQNPVSEEIVTDSFTKSEVDQLYSGLEGILANKRCNDFIAALLTEAGLRARNKPIETDMLKLFNKVTQQKGFAFATKYSTGPAGTSMQGYNGVSGSVMHGDATVLL